MLDVELRPSQSMIDVLVVDDDEAIAEFLKLILAEKGYSVSSALDCNQAMDILEQYRPRVLLLDLMLPSMSGRELAQTLRQSTSLKDVPIVIMSARSDAPEEAQAIGAAGYLRKPFDIDALYSCVAEHAGPGG